MQPINYSLPQPNFSQTFLEGLQLGDAMRVVQAKRREQQIAEEYKADLQKALSGSDPRAFLNLSVKYPEHGKGLKTVFDSMKQEQRDSEFKTAQEVFYSLQSGRPDVALGVIEQQAAAMTNSGQDAGQLKSLGEAIKRDPKSASQYVAAVLSGVAPKEYAATLEKLGSERRKDELHPGELAEQPVKLEKLSAEASKAKEDAKTAAVTARFAESNVVKDLEKKGWDIQKIQEDIKVAKINSQIAAANVSIGREANAIRRDELKLRRDELLEKRDGEVRGRAAEVESARFNIDNTLNTIDRILANKSLNSVVGSIEGRLPVVFSDQAADAVALIETLGSQAFLSQLPMIKGMGQLSNVEGDKMQKAFQNLGRVQSEKQFRESLDEGKRLYLKARRNIANKFGVPDTVPDTPAATTAAPSGRSSLGAGGRSVDDLVKQYAP